MEEETMKRHLIFILLFIAITAVADGNRRKTTHWTSHIHATEYVTRLNDDTFADVPEFNVDSSGDPPLSSSEAHRIAQTEFSRLREAQIQYVLKSIRLVRFHQTDHWYYLVDYGVSGIDWKNIEPYRTKIEEEEDAETGPPRITIAILLDGTVVKQSQWR